MSIATIIETRSSAKESLRLDGYSEPCVKAIFSNILTQRFQKAQPGDRRFRNANRITLLHPEMPRPAAVAYLAKTLMIAQASSSANPWFMAAAIRLTLDKVLGIKAFMMIFTLTTGLCGSI